MPKSSKKRTLRITVKWKAHIDDTPIEVITAEGARVVVARA